MPAAREYVLSINIDTTDFEKSLKNSEVGLNKVRQYFDKNPVSLDLNMKDGSNVTETLSKIANLIDKINNDVKKDNQSQRIVDSKDIDTLIQLSSGFQTTNTEVLSFITSITQLSTAFSAVVKDINAQSKNINIADNIKSEVSDAENALNELIEKQKFLNKFRNFADKNSKDKVKQKIQDKYLLWQSEAFSGALSKQEIERLKKDFEGSAAAYKAVFGEYFSFNDDYGQKVDLKDFAGNDYFAQKEKEFIEQQQLYLQAAENLRLAKEKYTQEVNTPVPETPSAKPEGKKKPKSKEEPSATPPDASTAITDDFSVIQPSNDEIESFKKLKEAAKDAAEAKNDFSEKNKNLQTVTNDSVLKIDAEKDAFDKLKSSAKEAIEAKDNFIKLNDKLNSSAIDSKAGSVNTPTVNGTVSLKEFEAMKNTPLAYFSKVNNSVAGMTDIIRGKFKNNGYENIEVSGVETLDKKISRLTVTAKDATGVLKTFNYERRKIEGQKNAYLVATSDVSVDKFSIPDNKKTTEEIVDNAKTTEEAVNKESASFLDLPENIDKAIEAKQNFVTANEKVRDIAAESVTNLNAEADAFERIAKIAGTASEVKEEYVAVDNNKGGQRKKRGVDKDELIKSKQSTLDTYKFSENTHYNQYKNIFEEQSADLKTLNQQLRDGTITVKDYEKATKELFNTLEKDSNRYTIRDGINNFEPGKADVWIDNFKKRLSDKELESLNISRNTNNGKDITTLTYQTQKLNGEIEKVKYTVDNVNGVANKTFDQSKRGLTSIDKFVTSLKSKFESLATWLLSFGSMRMLWNELKQGLVYVKEFDTALAQLKFVTESNNDQIEKFKREIRGVSKEVAETSTNLAQSATEWSRLGYNIEDSLTLTEASARYAKVGFTDTETATTNLISTLKAFEYEAEDAIGIVDKFINVDNKFAISAEEIGSGLTRSAAALKVAGNDLSESIALTTAGKIDCLYVQKCA